jgi:hypothetical protein
MNERIERLAFKVMDEPVDLERTHLKIDVVRFAELIVRECMTMSDELKARYFASRKSTMDFDEKNIYAEGEAACDTLRYKMKEHFGVE